MKLTVLGSGTSTGVPIMGCSCAVCMSRAPKDKRTRASILLQQDGFAVLIDSGPDVRTQLLREKVSCLDAVFYTHIHYDHCAGMDDLRPLSQKKEQPLPCYGDAFTIQALQTKNPHIGNWQKIPNLPRLALTTLQTQKENPQAFLPQQVGPFMLQPIYMQHVKHPPLASVGYVINRKLAYLTDFKHIEKSGQKHLYNLDVMILGAPLIREHPNHVSIPQACELLRKFRAKQGYITHLAHELSQQQLEERYGTDTIGFAFDGLQLTF